MLLRRLPAATEGEGRQARGEQRAAAHRPES
jgi:hypothetical protein